MKLSVAPWGATIDELIGAARDAESAGAAGVWLSEMHRSATVPLAAIARETSSIQVGTAVALAFVRSPMITALEALDLDELSGGRLILGVSTGVRRLAEEWHHVEWAPPVPRLREVVAGVRAFVATAHLGGPIEVPGAHAPMSIRGYRRPDPPVRTAIPIHIGAVGPRMTRLAGEIGDGWISHELCSPAYVAEQALPELRRGLAAGGRDRAELAVTVSLCCAPHPDGRQARRWAAGTVAFYATVKTYQPFFEFHGFGPQAHAVREAFRAGDERGMVDAVPDEMVDAFCAAGTPDEVHDRLARYAGLADEVKLSPPVHFVPPEATRAAQEGIIAMVGAG